LSNRINSPGSSEAPKPAAGPQGASGDDEPEAEAAAAEAGAGAAAEAGAKTEAAAEAGAKTEAAAVDCALPPKRWDAAPPCCARAAKS